MAISTTLFLYLHTRDLHTKLKEMEIKLQPDVSLSAQVSGNYIFFLFFFKLILWETTKNM